VVVGQADDKLVHLSSAKLVHPAPLEILQPDYLTAVNRSGAHSIGRPT